jgi:hypothetical protein
VDLASIVYDILEVALTLLLMYIGYVTLMGYQKTKNPNLAPLSTFFLLAAFLQFMITVVELGVGPQLVSSTVFDIIHTGILIIALGALAWTMRWQPTWKMALKPKK